MGIGIGLAGCFALKRVIANQLFEVQANIDAITLVGGAALLAGRGLTGLGLYSEPGRRPKSIPYWWLYEQE